uniref:Uncharacterized protein n=1 Tax=Oryza barthii TaxID=65489 RepID=A0A0D3GGB0_9ORYZ
MAQPHGEVVASRGLQRLHPHPSIGNGLAASSSFSSSTRHRTRRPASPYLCQKGTPRRRGEAAVGAGRERGEATVGAGWERGVTVMGAGGERGEAAELLRSGSGQQRRKEGDVQRRRKERDSGVNAEEALRERGVDALHARPNRSSGERICGSDTNQKRRLSLSWMLWYQSQPPNLTSIAHQTVCFKVSVIKYSIL